MHHAHLLKRPRNILKIDYRFSVSRKLVRIWYEFWTSIIWVFTNGIQKSRNSPYLFAAIFLRRWEFVRSLGIDLGLKIPMVGDGTIEGYQNDFWRSEESSEGSFDQIIQHLLTTSGYISNEINFQNSFLRSQKVKLLISTLDFITLRLEKVKNFLKMTLKIILK